jgi:hypothetical protein
MLQWRHGTQDSQENVILDIPESLADVRLSPESASRE